MRLILFGIIILLSGCKTKEQPARKLSKEEMVQIGRKLYRYTGCTDCHFITERELAGPGLKGVTKRRSKEWIIGIITNPDSMFKHDSIAKALYKAYDKIGLHMSNKGITREEAEAIYEFLKTLN